MSKKTKEDAEREKWVQGVYMALQYFFDTLEKRRRKYFKGYKGFDPTYPDER